MKEQLRQISILGVLLAIAAGGAPRAAAAASDEGSHSVVVDALGDPITINSTGVAVRYDQSPGGRCVVVASNAVGTGPSLAGAPEAALEAAGTVVLTSSLFDQVNRLDLSTGDRTVVSGGGMGSGPAIVFPYGIAVEASGDLVVTDNGSAGILRIDPVTGDRTVVSNNVTGSGPAFATTRGIAVEASGDLIVGDINANALYRVDPVTGDRTILSNSVTGTGPDLVAAYHIAIDANGDIVVSDTATDRLMRIDRLSGDRTAISDETTGGGPDFGEIEAVAVLPSGDLVVSQPYASTMLVDPATGYRTFLDCVCGATPATSCIDAALAKVLVNEKKPGKEKLKIGWKKLQSATTLEDFGDPVLGDVAVGLCVYDGDDHVVASTQVDTSIGPCSEDPCWSAKGTAGYAFGYKPTLNGIAKIGYGAGDVGKGKASISGLNNASKYFPSLATGLVAALSGGLPTVQLVTDAGLCIGATTTEIKKDDGSLFLAGKK